MSNMSSMISKKVIVGIVNGLSQADIQVKNAITMFYTLINQEIDRSAKTESNFGWELRPIKASPIIAIDKDKNPCIGVEMLIGFTSKIMDGDYIDLFKLTNQNKFRKGDPCDFKAVVCYDLLSDPVKPSNLEDLTMFMKQYFKEWRRNIENIWTNQVICTMEMSRGEINDEENEEQEKQTVNRGAIPVPSFPNESMSSDNQELEDSQADSIPAEISRQSKADQVLGSFSPTRSIPSLPGSSPATNRSLNSTKKDSEEMIQESEDSSLPVQKQDPKKTGGIRRRMMKKTGEFDIREKGKSQESPIPSVASAATPKQRMESIMDVVDDDDDDDEKLPAIPKLPVLDGTKLKNP